MEPARFRFNPNTGEEEEEEEENLEFSAILEIFIHHARNIHNICIYGNQDVYAKFSLTYNPDETISTRIINGGGKNPDFNQNLQIKLTNLQSVLKCEIWMLSRARNLLEDQPLGFILVPLSSIKAKITEDFTLSSTDLFHSPAGIVRLTLSLIHPPNPPPSGADSCVSSEIVFPDRSDYMSIEFPEIKENQKMISEYLIRDSGSLLHLGTRSNPMYDNESEFFSSTITSSIDSREKFKSCAESEKSRSASVASSEGAEKRDEKKRHDSVPLRLVDHDAEQCAMQKQVVDMYIRSVKQFTESLPKMQLPLDLASKVEDDSARDSMENGGKKDGPRLFYGSHAFF